MTLKYFLGGFRRNAVKTRSGNLYLLEKDRMVQVIRNPYDDVYYSLERSELSIALDKYSNGEKFPILQYLVSDNTRSARSKTSFHIDDENTVLIGCQAFTGNNGHRLLMWAGKWIARS